MTLEVPASCCDSAKNRELAVRERAGRGEITQGGGKRGRAAGLDDAQSVSKGSKHISEGAFLMGQGKPISGSLKSAWAT